jgi:hypothetical protein
MIAGLTQTPVRCRRRKQVVGLLVLAISLLLVVSAGGCGSTARTPRTPPSAVPQGTVACQSTPRGPLILLTTPAGRIYALDQLAEDRGFPAIGVTGKGFGLGLLVGKALQLCPSQSGAADRGAEPGSALPSYRRTMGFEDILAVLLDWLGLEVEVVTHGANGAQPVAALEAQGRLRRSDSFGTESANPGSVLFVLDDDDGKQIGSFRL